MGFSTNGHKAEEKEFVNKYLSPGIAEAKIKKIEYIKANSGTEGIIITHEGKPETDLNGEGKITETTFWMSEAAWPATKNKLAIMAEKWGVTDQLNAIDTPTAEEYAIAVNKLFAGKVARWMFIGEEIKGKEGKQNWFKAKLASFGFMETLDTNPSKLKFDPNNKWHMIKLPVAEVETPSSNGEAVANW